MKKILILVLLLGLININTLPCYAKTVKVRANTPVEFTVAEVKSSADTAVGEKVSITVDNDVVVNGVKVFKTGAKGYLLVNDVQKERFGDKAEKLLLLEVKFLMQMDKLTE